MSPTSRPLHLFAYLITGLAAVSAPGATEAHAQTVDTILAGSTAAGRLQLPVSVADTIDRFFEQSGQMSPAGVFFVQGRRVDGDLYLITNEAHGRRGNVTYDTIAVSVDGIRPVWHRVHAATDSADVTYTATAAHGWVAPAREARKEVHRTFDQLPFPSYRFLIGMLPLAEGYRAQAPTYDMWTDEITWADLHVVRAEEVERQGGSVNTWVVEVSLANGRGPYTFWIDQSTRQEVKQAQTFPDGRKVWQIRR